MTADPVPQETDVRWGLGDAALGFLIGICAQSLLGSLVYGASGNRLTLGAVAAGLFGLWFGLAGVAVWACRGKGSGSLARDFGLRIAGWADAGIGIFAGLASQLVLVPLLYAPLIRASPTVRTKLEKPARDLVDLVHGNGGVVVLTLLVVVAAPVVEELFFRGLLQRALVRRVGPVWAVVLSALAFGIAHQELLQLPALVAFGVVLGILAQRSGRLGPGIFAHMAFNAVTVFSLVHAR